MHNLRGATEPPTSSPYRGLVVACLYGGALEVARLDRTLHGRSRWNGRCRSCGEPSPCPTRRRAELALAGDAA